MAADETDDGRLKATIGATGLENALRTIHVTRTDNAEVEIAGQGGRSGAFTIEPPAGTMRVELLVRRLSPGASATVHFVAVDRCGSWSSLVGGGRDAWDTSSSGAAAPGRRS